MLIILNKFGTTLVSRSDGKEAFLAYSPILRSLKPDEVIEIDFNGVIAMGPSWGDEFITPLFEKYNGQIKLLNTQNPSVKATLEMLKEVWKNSNFK
jgi:hypothetical protein